MTQHINIVAQLVVVLVVVTLLCGPILLICFGLRRAKRGLARGRIIAGLGTVLLLVFLAPLAYHLFLGGPWLTRIVTQGTSPSGQEYCIVQAFQNLAEPYQISFYVRDTNGVWRWNYLDHEGYAWWNAGVEFSGAQALVSRNGKPFREITMPTGTVDLASIPSGYKNHYCPSEFTVDDVFAFHTGT